LKKKQIDKTNSMFIRGRCLGFNFEPIFYLQTL
jgi:hypothetical protein